MPVNCRGPCFFSCWSTCLEEPAAACHICTFTAVFLNLSENASFPYLGILCAWTTTQMPRGSCWPPPLRQTGEDNRVVPASHGSAPSNRIWNITILSSPKQQIWLRTALCGGWCRRMALRNRELHARNDDSSFRALFFVSFTSSKGGGICFCPCSFVCLSVCLWARLLKDACMDLDQMLHVMDELVNFWARSTS